METFDKHIVAIDLGSSVIALTVAKVNGDDIQIIYYRETPSAGIRYSSVFNVTHASEPLIKAIKEAEAELDIKITQAVVGMPKFPIRQERSRATIPDRGADTDITAENVADLKRFAQSLYPMDDNTKEAIYGAVAQSFSDGENFQIIEKDIIGMTSDVLDGDFKIFIGKKSDLNRIDTVMAKAGIVAMRKYFTAESTAKAVLRESEMENGVALIDMGGGSTSVSIYHGNIMRHYASIPFGGKNITQDIRSECQISEQLAENIKLEYGACMPDKLLSLSDKILHIRSSIAEGDKQLPVKYLSEIITARLEEIIMAILYEIEQSGFADMLRSGIVITGGCAQTANLGSLIYDLSGYKVRTGYPRKVFSCQDCEGLTETSAATSIGLILAAVGEQTVNCAVGSTERISVDEVEVVTSQGTLFNEDEIETVRAETPVPRREKSKLKVSFTKLKNECGVFFDSLFYNLEDNSTNNKA